MTQSSHRFAQLGEGGNPSYVQRAAVNYSKCAPGEGQGHLPEALRGDPRPLDHPEHDGQPLRRRTVFNDDIQPERVAGSVTFGPGTALDLGQFGGQFSDGTIPTRVRTTRRSWLRDRCPSAAYACLPVVYLRHGAGQHADGLPHRIQRQLTGGRPGRQPAGRRGHLHGRGQARLHERPDDQRINYTPSSVTFRRCCRSPQAPRPRRHARGA